MEIRKLKLRDFRKYPMKERAHCIFKEQECQGKQKYFPVNAAAYDLRNLVTGNIWMDEVSLLKARLFVDIEIVCQDHAQ